MSKQSIPRRLDKQWRREYDKQYRIKNQARIRAQQTDYNSRPEGKAHRKEAVRRWYDKHKKEVIAKHRQQDSTIQGKIRRWKAGAKRRRIEWLLQDEFVVGLPRVCHYTGMPLVLENGHPNTMSLDRVDSSEDYTPSNVKPCCAMVNAMKQDFSESDFIAMCRKIVHHKDH